MKTKALTISFLIIVFALAIVNIGNGARALDPLISHYIHKEKVEGAHSAKDLISMVDSNYNDNFVSKMAFVEVQGATRLATGSRIYNGTLRLNNGRLTYQYKRFDAEKYADNITALRDFVEDRGSEFLYVALPFKVDPYNDNADVPTGTYEFSNNNQDRMLARLAEHGVYALDMRPLLREYADKELDGNWYDAFFKYDQHWQPRTAFWAYGKLADMFHRDFGLKLDKRSLDFDNYNVDTYESWFLGSQGKKTGIIYSGIEDFDVIYPKFDTNITLKVPIHDETRKGSFYDVMFKQAHLKKDYYNVNTYASYIGGDYPLCIMKNEDAVNDKRILILKDSFTVAIQPYFSFLFKEVDVIDLRGFTGQNKTTREYIEELDPDIVMVFYTSSMMNYPEAYEYGLED